LAYLKSRKCSENFVRNNLPVCPIAVLTWISAI
jgi:hypothetical protein